jgi:diguanylate cyclase (GGDEF)-like protein
VRSQGRLLVVWLVAAVALLAAFGVVLWDRHEENEFGRAEVVLGLVAVAAAAAFAASALRAFRLLGGYVSELERSRVEFRDALTRLGDALAASDRDRIIDVLVDATRLMTGADSTTFSRVEGSHLVLRATGGDQVRAGPRLAVGDGVAGRATVSSVRWPPAADAPAPAEPGASSAIAVPIFTRNHPYGVLAAYRGPGRSAFGEADLADLEAFAHQAEAALENTFLHDETRRLSLTDGLTTVWNRRQFDLRCAQELERAARFGEPFAIVICDLDDFKSVNDRFHHPGGDAVLVEFAQRLVAITREVDFVGRYGGEEFVLVLPRTSCEGAQVVAEAARRAAADRPFDTGNGEARVTVSIGVACHPEHGTSRQQLVEAADAALFEAKAAGKNVVRTAPSRSDPAPREVQ